MTTAFDTFDQYGFGAYDGQVADMGNTDIVSRIADEAIGYGLGVVDTSDATAKLPTGSEVSTGITVRETVRTNQDGLNPVPEYAAGETMSVIRVGRVHVTTVDGAALGDDVYVVPATGEITNAAASGTNIQIPRATFKSAADAAGRALVQLNG